MGNNQHLLPLLQRIGMDLQCGHIHIYQGDCLHHLQIAAPKPLGSESISPDSNKDLAMCSIVKPVGKTLPGGLITMYP